MLINKKTLEYLAELGRIELKAKDEQKLLKDLQEILEYFGQLKEVDAESIEPMAGGITGKNVFREDKAGDKKPMPDSNKVTESFPEEEKGYLKVPPVFKQ